MEQYIKNHGFYSQIKEILNNIEKIINIALDNMPTKISKEIDLSNLEFTDDIKRRKIISRILHSCNNIASNLLYGPANVCLIDIKYYNLMLPLIINNEISGSGIKVVFDENLDNHIICARLLSTEDIKIINSRNNSLDEGMKYDISKQYSGFKIID